jgi:predicted ATP-grasp superfamily ATP-dependent carboligase
MASGCKGTFAYPDPQDNVDAFVCAVVKKAKEVSDTLVLPMTESTTFPLSARRNEIFAVNGRMVMPPHEFVIRAFDKWETLRLARRLGIRVPETVLLGSEDSPHRFATKLRYPIVLKPRNSFEPTKRGEMEPTGRPLYARSPQESASSCEQLFQRCSSILAQEFIAGPGAGYFALLHQGSLRAEFAHRRIRDVYPSGSGSSLRVSVRPDPTLREAGLAILRALNWHGVAMVEFRLRPDGTPIFMEVNGRFWNSLALAVHAGVDFPAMVAQIAAHGDIPTAVGYREGVRCRWLVGDFRHLMQVWKGRPPTFPAPYPNRMGTLLRFFLPIRGTFHDNFRLADPLPELGDWMDLVFHRLPSSLKRTAAVREKGNAARFYTRA